MFKKKNKILLGGAILAAMGGINSAQAATPGNWCDSEATILSATAVTVGDVKACGTSLINSNPVDYGRLSKLAERISTTDGSVIADGNDDLSLRAAQDMSNPIPATAGPATSLYLSILSSSPVDADKNRAALSAARTLVDHADIMVNNTVVPAVGTTGYIDLLVCSALAQDSAVFTKARAAAATAATASATNQTELNVLIAKCGSVVGGGGGTPGALPSVSRGNLGQVLIYPYYTTRGGKKSLVNVFNTSDRTIAAKVRFRESHNSRDVLDFTVILSPHDKWSGTVQDHGTGPYFTTNDNTCTVPAIAAGGEALNTDAFTGNAFDGDTFGVERLKEGYIEIIAMGAAISENAQIAVNAKHIKTGNETKPKNCAAIAANNGPFSPMVDFSVDKSGLPLAKLQFEALKAGENPLRGALTIINPGDNGAKGVGFGVSALAIENFKDNTASTDDLITAQTPKYFHEPTIASRDGIWTISGLGDVEGALSARTVINEWANNTANGANSDWIVQFPTKSFHVDCGVSNSLGVWTDTLQAARNTSRGIATYGVGGNACGNALLPVDSKVTPFENYFINNNGSAVTLNTVKVFDNEENMIDNSPSGPGVSFSPATPNQVNVLSLRWESNIIAFSDINAPVSVMSSIAPTLHTMGVVSSDLTGQNGYAEISFKNALPVIGFVAKDRNQDDSSVNFGQIMRHSYR